MQRKIGKDEVDKNFPYLSLAVDGQGNYIGRYEESNGDYFLSLEFDEPVKDPHHFFRNLDEYCTEWEKRNDRLFCYTDIHGMESFITVREKEVCVKRLVDTEAKLFEKLVPDEHYETLYHWLWEDAGKTDFICVSLNRFNHTTASYLRKDGTVFDEHLSDEYFDKFPFYSREAYHVGYLHKYLNGEDDEYYPESAKVYEPLILSAVDNGYDVRFAYFLKERFHFDDERILSFLKEFRDVFGIVPVDPSNDAQMDALIDFIDPWNATPFFQGGHIYSSSIESMVKKVARMPEACYLVNTDYVPYSYKEALVMEKPLLWSRLSWNDKEKLCKDQKRVHIIAEAIMDFDPSILAFLSDIRDVIKLPVQEERKKTGINLFLRLPKDSETESFQETILSDEHLSAMIEKDTYVCLMADADFFGMTALMKKAVGNGICVAREAAALCNGRTFPDDADGAARKSSLEELFHMIRKELPDTIYELEDTGVNYSWKKERNAGWLVHVIPDHGIFLKDVPVFDPQTEDIRLSEPVLSRIIGEVPEWRAQEET